MNKLPKRFTSKICVMPNGCWEWRGTHDKDGYGHFRIGSRTNGSLRMVLAHRFAYETLVGPIPEGLQLDHLCRNTPCVNPLHLEVVTLQENIRRGRLANTSVEGLIALKVIHMMQRIPMWTEREDEIADYASERVTSVGGREAMNGNPNLPCGLV